MSHLLKLVTSTPSAPVPPEERLRVVRQDIETSLAEAVQALERESQALYATMEQALYRIRTQGVHVRLDDLRTGRWHSVANRVRVLQEALDSFEANE